MTYSPYRSPYISCGTYEKNLFNSQELLVSSSWKKDPPYTLWNLTMAKKLLVNDKSDGALTCVKFANKSYASSKTKPIKVPTFMKIQLLDEKLLSWV